jgi:hypothetical protein
MINEIKLFLFVLSITYNLRFIVEFVIKLTQENPEPMKITSTEKVFVYFALSYIITYLLT